MKVNKADESEIEMTNSWETWEKEVSEFPWEYDEKETCYIIEGKAEVISSTGEKITFKAGDMIEFEQGLKCNWKITEAIRKKYIFG